MRISTHGSTYYGFFDQDKKRTMAALKEAGFDCMALGVMTHRPEWSPENFEASAAEIRRYSEELDLPINIAHSAGSNREAMERSMKIAALCGAKYWVIHPRIPKPYQVDYRRLQEENFPLAIETIASYAELAKEYGIGIAVENMFKYDWDWEYVRDASCSQPDEFIRYVDTLNEMYPGVFSACLDTGHVALVDQKPEDVIRTLGKRLTCLHVHDNDLTSDMHTIPGLFKIDHVKIAEALHDVGYQGDFTLELSCPMPKELVPAHMKYSATVARYYASLFDEK
ncbi:MAG: sugar phosphate isomerase/epimerase [Clostridia bacterium]|nr:sugar phosphate isomerase/epimerase [Clostridia bacterium]